MYEFYVECSDHSKDFDVEHIRTVVVRRFQVVGLFHQDDDLDAKRGFGHCLPRNERKEAK